MLLRRRIVIIAVALLIVAALIYGFLPKPLPVDIAKVATGALRVTIDEEAKTRVKDRFVISAPVAGYMRRIELEVGDRVGKGQKVAEIEPLRSEPLDPRSRAQAEALVSAAQATLKSARENARARDAESDFAKNQLERSKKLYAEGYISKEAFDQVESDARKAEAGLLSADAEVKAAASELERAQAALIYSAKERSVKHMGFVPLRAPVSGRVLKIRHESAGVVNAGEDIIDIGDPERLEVNVEVLSTDAVKIKPGTQVLFDRWGGDLPLTGKVRAIEPQGFIKVSSLGVEEQRVVVIADITSEQEKWQKLGDGYSLEARFILWEGRNVLQVPASAMFRYGHDWAVFVVEKKRARLRKVHVGHSNGLAAEIVSGLAEGEMVIVHPDESIKDGTRVRVR